MAFQVKLDLFGYTNMIPIRDLGAVGLVTDVLPYRLPPNAWTDVRNVRFLNGEMYSTLGHKRIMGAPTTPPHWIFPAVSASGGVPLWAYAGPADIYATDGTTHGKITRVSGVYTGTVDTRFQGSPFGGLFVFNNGVDVPQLWNGPEIATKLIDLPNWPASTTAKLFRPFGRFLVAYDVIKSGTRYKHLIKWSDLADPGTVPGSWNEADPTILAGENVLNETDGEILEAKQLGQTNFIYKSDSVIRMEFVGGTFVFDFKTAFGDFGILSGDCVAEWKGQHVVAGREDVLIHNGVDYRPLLQGKYRRDYSGRLSSSKADRSFVAMNYGENEAWVCFPEEGAEWPSLAMIVNLDSGATTLRDLDDISHMAFSVPPSATGTSFDSIATPFDSMVGFFDQSNSGKVKKQIIGVSPTNIPYNPTVGAIHLFDSGLDFDGAPIIAYAEREQILVGGITKDGYQADHTREKFISELWPKITLPQSGSLKIRIGVQENFKDPIAWTDFVFNDGDLTIEPALDCRIWSIRFESDDPGHAWNINEYDINVRWISV